MYSIWILIFLFICTITDVKNRTIYGWLCILNMTAVVIIHVLNRDISAKSIITGIIIGGVFLIISLVTKEKIGYGDSLVFLTIGMILGGEKCFNIIFWSFFSCSIYSIVLMVLKRTSFKSTIAFMPFVLLGTLITFGIGWIV